MAFHSILFDDRHDGASVDDGGVESVTAGRDEYELRPFFWRPLGSVDAVAYRHEVFRDLRGTPLLGWVGEFAARMRSMRDCLVQADKLRYRYQRERRFLDAALVYCDAVRRLADDLSRAEIGSRGFLALREHAIDYLAGDGFGSLVAEAETLRHALDQVDYCVHIDGLRVRVSRYEGQADYSAEVGRTFAKFAQGTVKEHRTTFRSGRT